MENNNPLSLMYITNSPIIAQCVEESGIDYLFIDLETIGKEKRQKNLDTVKSHHSFEDISVVRPFLHNSKLLVRINPFYENTKNEVEKAISNGADAIMLPMFENASQVKQFVEFVNKRAEVILLLETIEAKNNLRDILTIPGIDRIHIGLNDLHLQMKKKFMFELLVDGTVEEIINKIKQTDIKYGFGGVSRIGDGILPATNILSYHYYLNSSSVILSRSFCNLEKTNVNDARLILKKGVADLRNYYSQLKKKDDNYFKNNYLEMKSLIGKIVEGNL